MADARTMPLNLSPREMEVLEELATSADLSKTAVLRQALKVYQLIHLRLLAGETLCFSGDAGRTAAFIGPLGLGERP